MDNSHRDPCTRLFDDLMTTRRREQVYVTELYREMTVDDYDARDKIADNIYTYEL